MINAKEILETRPVSLGLELLEERTLGGGHCPVGALIARDGVCIMPHWRRDHTHPERIYSYSLDGGTSWEERQVEPPIQGEIIQLADGSFLGIAGRSPLEHEVNSQQLTKPYIAHLRRAGSPRDLLEGKWEDGFASIQIPYLYGGMSDEGLWYLGNCDGGLVEMPSGYLINTMSGNLKFDRTPISYFKQPAYQYRVWSCISRDRGVTWQYLSTVASSDTFEVPAMAEGFNESALACTGEDSLVCVMRTGGNPHQWPSCFFPLYASRSRDGGLSWDQPRRVAPHGVKPMLLRMSNGVLVCKSGRPGTFLVFSADGGDTWSQPHVIDDYDADWVPGIHCSCGYGSIGEIEPGVLIVLYDEYDNEGSQGGGFILKQRKYSVACL
ncbi:MAG: sialidase family protein [Candidatus Latescibacterota bacterium]